MPDTTLSRFVDVGKALGHPVRLRMLAMLRDGDLCVCQFTAILGLANSTVSAHLAELRRAGLVTERKEGRWVHYELTTHPTLARLVGDVLAGIRNDPVISEDRRLVQALRRVPTDVLCRAGLDLQAVGVKPAAPRALGGRP